jgi:hypothetical protein
MPETTARLFVSYSTKDSATVGEIVNALRAQGLGVWLDQSEINAGDNIVGRIDAGLSAWKYFLLFASQNYFSSEWTKAEYRAAFYAAIGADDRKIVVVSLDEVPLPALIASNRYIRYTTAPAVAEEIVRVVQKTDVTRRAASDQTGEVASIASQKVLDWASIGDDLMRLAVRELVQRRSQLLSTNSTSVRLKANENGFSITLRVAKPALQDDILFLDIESELQNYLNVAKISASLRKRLLQGGLGIFEGPFEIELENRQTQLGEIKKRLREQLSAVVPEVYVSAAQAS